MNRPRSESNLVFPTQQLRLPTVEIELNVRVSGVGPAVLLLDTLGHAQPVHVVGQDWGDLVAWCLAMARAGRVRSNVVISLGHPHEYAHAGLDACTRAMSRPGRLTAGLNWYRANLVQVLFGKWPAWDDVRIDGAGHWLPLEQPQRISELALDWFERPGMRT